MIFVTVSTGHFDPLIRACNELAARESLLGQIGSGTVVPSFPHFRTAEPAQIQKHMRDAELVVSHAGTGMLSLLYRLKKPSIVVPKQVRYGESNDGQVELARKWAELGMTVLCMDVGHLGEAIERCRRFEFRFPAFPALGSALLEQMGIVPISRRAVAR